MVFRHAQLDKREREKALRAEEAQKRNQQRYRV